MKKFKLWKVFTVIGDILVVCSLTYSVYALKAAQINVQCSLILELMFYKFELGHNATEATKNICHVKGEGTVDQSTITRSFEKFSSRKNFDDQDRPGRCETINSEAMLKAIE